MYVLGIALAVTVVDQLAKYAVHQTMVLHESIPVIPGFFHITYILNRGAAFGILENQRWLFLVMVYGGAGLLLGGALGNALDRTFCGAVTDFFDFRIWPVFNVADIGIVVGVVLLLWYSWNHISDK